MRWVRNDRVSLRLVDVVSAEGFFESLARRIARYPAFVMDRRTSVGADLSQVERLIPERLAAARS